MSCFWLTNAFLCKSSGFDAAVLGDVEAVAQQAAEQHDPQGLYVLWICWEMDAQKRGKALPLLREAAELDFVAAQYRYGLTFADRTDRRRYMWIGRACRGCTSKEECHLQFLREMKDALVADVLNGEILAEDAVSNWRSAV